MRRLTKFVWSAVFLALATNGCAGDDQSAALVADDQNSINHRLSCSPIFGAVSGIQGATPSIVVFGEVHGTKEFPQSFAELVCEFALSRKVAVAIEWPTQEQPILDAFFATPVRANAVELLRGARVWKRENSDGRFSEAYFDMLLRFWDIRTSGADIAVHAFRNDAVSGEAFAFGMADNLREIALTDTDMVLVLTGNFHSMSKSLRGAVPMASLLEDETSLSILFSSNGGRSWNCSPICGENEDPSTPNSPPAGFRFVDEDKLFHEAVLQVGQATNSSKPLHPNLNSP